jgi:hypothetical protein
MGQERESLRQYCAPHHSEGILIAMWTMSSTKKRLGKHINEKISQADTSRNVGGTNFREEGYQQRINANDLLQWRETAV